MAKPIDVHVTRGLTPELVRRYVAPVPAAGPLLGSLAELRQRRERTAGAELDTRWSRWKDEWDGFWDDPPPLGRAAMGTRWDRLASEWRWDRVTLLRFLGGIQRLSGACAELAQVTPLRLDATIGSDPGSWVLRSTIDPEAPTSVGDEVRAAFEQWRRVAERIAALKTTTRYLPLPLVRPCSDGARVYDWDVAVVSYHRYTRQDGAYRTCASYNPLYTLGVEPSAAAAYNLPTMDFPQGSLGAARRAQWMAYHFPALMPVRINQLCHIRFDQPPDSSMASAARGLTPGSRIVGIADPAQAAKQWWTVAAWLHRGGDGGVVPTIWGVADIGWQAQFVRHVLALAALDAPGTVGEYAPFFEGSKVTFVRPA